MKKSFAFFAVSAFLVFTVSAQKKFESYQPVTKLSPDLGYITINEFHLGVGLGETNTPYSTGFWGFTTVNGYQYSKSIVAGAGTGLTFYESGLLVPIYLDFRLRFDINTLTPYITADGGFLFNFSDFVNPRLFISPEVGIRYALSRNLATNLSTGLLTQYGEFRDTFIDFKMGFTYKF